MNQVLNELQLPVVTWMPVLVNFYRYNSLALGNLSDKFGREFNSLNKVIKDYLEQSEISLNDDILPQPCNKKNHAGTTIFSKKNIQGMKSNNLEENLFSYSFHKID